MFVPVSPFVVVNKTPFTRKRGSIHLLSSSPAPLRASRGGGVPYGSLENEPPPPAGAATISPRRSYVVVAVLCYVNLLNYMDRYTIAGILDSIQTYFNIDDGSAGLLQTGEAVPEKCHFSRFND
uniref:Major facilitator superfamily (MFS) profile domain-containing protein n=1 Tax=Paramormyrops kingsleyae TaxID=1676925 RepID=A0A3B3TFZ4_9TELE